MLVIRNGMMYDSGDVYIPEDYDGRRMADKKFGWIHPCCTYPLSDIEICVYPTK